MTEPTINPTTTDSTTAADDTATTAITHRVSGHVPLTVTVTADSSDDATVAATGAVAAVFADLAGVTLTPDRYAVSNPTLVEEPADAGQPGRYRLEVTAYGHLDLAADDHVDAIVVAEETLLAYLAGRAEVTADWVFAVCDDVTPLERSNSTE
jgi:hypothetical protein